MDSILNQDAFETLASDTYLWFQLQGIDLEHSQFGTPPPYGYLGSLAMLSSCAVLSFSNVEGWEGVLNMCRR